ncbi:MAG: alpha/beta fold hydrolase [Chitinophagaceae bacterium]|nr:alpha/beta fold hydrolase [Oligoflexus sp.]
MSTTPLFFESVGQSIFGILHEPSAGHNLREAVVICPPAPQELKKYHWAQRQMANRLQLFGYTVLRFDYFATGDSSGRSEEFNLDICQHNIRDAIAFVKASGLVRRVTVIATRLGGPLALKTLESERVKRLVLIDPVLDGSAYLSRMQTMHADMLVESPETAPFQTSDACHRQLLGFSFSEALAAQMRRLSCAVGQLKAKSVYLLQSENAANLTALQQALTASVDEVHIKTVGGKLKWDDLWSLQFQDFPNELIQETLDVVRFG